MGGLLTIAIPTFNRPEAVRDRILELLNLPNEILEEIEVLIADNGTERVNLGQFIGSELKIRHIINATNLGLGKNIECLAKNANNKFMWLVSDDDEILWRNLHSLVKILLETESALILLDSSNQDFESARQSQKAILTSLIFISACIFRIDVVRSKLLHDKSGDVNPTYQQVFLGMELIYFGFKPYLIRNDFVRDTNTQKNYKSQASFNVRIGHFLLLEKQLTLVGMRPQDFEYLSELIDSHLINYAALMAFEFIQRKDFRLFLKLLFRNINKSIFRNRRMAATMFAFLVFSLGLIDFRIARFFVISIFRIFRLKFSFRLRDLNFHLEEASINEAGSLGYE